MKLGLAPIIWPDSRILILGSLPGDESIRRQQYYGNPANHFWTMLAHIHSEPPHAHYDERIAFLRRHGIALWDVLKCAERAGSLDNRIRNSTVNDFSQLFVRAPALRAIAFNGVKSAATFDRFIAGQMDPARLQALDLIRLPSTSPIPGKNVPTFAQKVEKWKILTQYQQA